MELELGLALHVLDTTRGFDLNRNGCDGNEVFGSEPGSCLCVESMKHAKPKRGFEEAFGKNKNSSKELSLLFWSGRPNKEDDDRKDTNKRSSCAILIDSEEEDKVVGWPPVKSWRKIHFYRVQQGAGSDRTQNHYRVAHNEDGGIVFKPRYVKVKMEGVPIGRKIDVGLYHSYQMLKTALVNMFTDSSYEKCRNSYAGFTLTYQDKEGDWLLAGDLPWKTFLGSVQCMKILRRRPSN